VIFGGEELTLFGFVRGECEKDFKNQWTSLLYPCLLAGMHCRNEADLRKLPLNNLFEFSETEHTKPQKRRHHQHHPGLSPRRLPPISNSSTASIASSVPSSEAKGWEIYTLNCSSSFWIKVLTSFNIQPTCSDHESLTCSVILLHAKAAYYCGVLLSKL